MKNVSLIEDRKSGGVFAAIVSGPNGIRAYGASGQGLAWAKWVNEEKLSMQELEATLDTTLVIQKPKTGKNIDTDNFVGVFDKQTLDSFTSDINTKQLLQIVKTKSEPEEPVNQDLAFEMEFMYADEESIANWPITDVSLASIDVAYKSNALNYKAKAFNLDRQASSMMLQVKGVRAVWDPDMPGGGGYRCPDDTPNGGQFTNRLGTGCSFGVMRRIGRGLMGASLRDITQNVTGDVSEAQARIMYNLGRSLEESGKKRQERLQEKFKRRMERRVRKLTDRDKRRQGAPTFSQIYRSLNPDMARRDRARIAVGNVMSRMGGDIANSGHLGAQNRRLTRRAKVKTPRPWDSVIDPSITPEQRRMGGRLDTQYGGWYNETRGELWDFDLLVPSEPHLEYLYGKDVVADAILNDPDFPRFMSRDELAALSGKTALQEIASAESLKALSANMDGHKASHVTSRFIDLMREGQNKDGYFRDVLGLFTPGIDPKLRERDKRGNYKDIPRTTLDIGHIVGVDSDGNLIYWENLQKMRPVSDYEKSYGPDESAPFIRRFFTKQDPSVYDQLSTIPKDTGITPVEAMVLFPSVVDVYGVRHTSLRDAIDAHVEKLNNLEAGKASPITFKVMNDDDFKRDFPNGWKERDTGSVEWNKRSSRIAQALRNTAEAIQSGSRRRSRRQRSSDTQPVDDTTPSTPNTPNVTQPKRQRRGTRPRVGSVVQRFRENQNERLRRRTVKKRRTAKGRKPSPTDTRLERAAKRYRRRANRLAEIPDELSDYPSYSGGLPDPNLGLAGLLRPAGSDNSDIPEMFRLDEANVAAERAKDTVVDDAFKTTANIEDSNGMYEALEFHDRRSKEGNGIPGLRPSIEKFDNDNYGVIQSRIMEIGEQIQEIINQDKANGTERYKEVEIGPDSGVNWVLLDGKVIGIDDTNNGVMHVMSIDGKRHIGTIISDTTAGGKIESYVASDSLRDELLGRKKRGSLRQRLMSRRRVVAPGSPAATQVVPTAGQSLRARSRNVIKSKTQPGFLFGKTTTGIALAPNYSQPEIDSLLAASELELDAHLDRWRKRLGITDLSLPIDEDDVQKYIQNVAQADKKRAAMNALDWHNTLMLAEITSRKDHTLIDYLKPQARTAVIVRAGVPYGPQGKAKARRSVTPPNLSNPPSTPPASPPGSGGGPNPPSGGASAPTPSPSGPSAPPSRPAPAAPSTPSTPSAPAPTTPSAPATPPAPPPTGVSPPAPQGPAPTTTPNPSGVIFSPGPVTPTIVPNITPATKDPLPLAVGDPTGPEIEANVGNPALGITYLPQQQAYLDTTTDEFVEDLSGITQNTVESLVIPAFPLDESSDIYPTVKLPGSKFEQFIVAPGVDATKLSKKVKKKNPNATKTQTTGIFDSFARAVRTNKELTTPRGNRVMWRGEGLPRHIAKIDFGALPSDPTQRAEELIKQLLAMDDKSSGIFSLPEANTDKLRQMLADIQNGVYAANGQPNPTVADVVKQVIARHHGRLADDNELQEFLKSFNLPEDVDSINTTVYFNASLDDVYRTDQDMRTIGLLNKALRQENEYRQLYLKHKPDIDNGIPLSPNDAKELDRAKVEAVNAWVDASAEMVDTIVSAATARDTSLAGYRQRKTKYHKDRYLTRGAVAELFSAMVDAELAGNPFALGASGVAVRARMERRAKGLNIRRRAIKQRLLNNGRRNVGLHDNSPDILDPWKSDTPPLAPRTPDDIIGLSLAHKSEGIFGDARTGTTDFTEEQIAMLSQMVEVADEGYIASSGKVRGPIGTPLEFQEYNDVGQAHVAVIWYYNGWDSLPVAVNMDEATAMLSEPNAQGNPRAVAVTRGVNGSPSEQVQYVNSIIRGERFIPGQGGSASGRGEYWSQNPNGWASYHGGRGGTAVAIVTEDMNIVSRDNFRTVLSDTLNTPLSNLYNVLGEQGTLDSDKTTSSGTMFSLEGVAQRMAALKVDPNTGLYDPAELALLEQHVAEVTKTGNPLQAGSPDGSSWGSSTLEGWILSNPGRINQDLREAVIPELKAGATVEEIQRAQEQREWYNAWIRQHLTWTLELAKSRRDESGPDSATAKEINRNLARAQRMLTHMTDENRASLMGIDALYGEQYGGRYGGPNKIENLFTRHDTWNNSAMGISSGAVDRLVVLNRSAMIYYMDPVGHFHEWRDILRGITLPDGTTAYRPNMNW